MHSSGRLICESAQDQLPINSPCSYSHTMALSPQHALLAVSGFCSDLEASCILVVRFEVQLECKASTPKGKLLRQNFARGGRITRAGERICMCKDLSSISSLGCRAVVFVWLESNTSLPIPVLNSMTALQIAVPDLLRMNFKARSDCCNALTQLLYCRTGSFIW